MLESFEQSGIVVVAITQARTLHIRKGQTNALAELAKNKSGTPIYKYQVKAPNTTSLFLISFSHHDTNHIHRRRR
jgi:hypothetical protein